MQLLFNNNLNLQPIQIEIIFINVDEPSISNKINSLWYICFIDTGKYTLEFGIQME